MPVTMYIIILIDDNIHASQVKVKSIQIKGKLTKRC